MSALKRIADCRRVHRQEEVGGPNPPLFTWKRACVCVCVLVLSCILMSLTWLGLEKFSVSFIHGIWKTTLDLKMMILSKSLNLFTFFGLGAPCAIWWALANALRVVNGKLTKSRFQENFPVLMICKKKTTNGKRWGMFIIKRSLQFPSKALLGFVCELIRGKIWIR